MSTMNKQSRWKRWLAMLIIAVALLAPILAPVSAGRANDSGGEVALINVQPMVNWNS